MPIPIEASVIIILFLVSFIAGCLVIWGRTNKTIEGHGTALVKIEKADYIKRVECRDISKNCKKEIEEIKKSDYIKRREYEDDMKHFCRKIEEVKVIIRGMDEKRESARETQNKELIKIAKFMGKVQQFMADSELKPRKVAE